MNVVRFDHRPAESDAEAELREARARIAMLERTLVLTLRQNAAILDRARRAEETVARLAEDRRA